MKNLLILILTLFLFSCKKEIKINPIPVLAPIADYHKPTMVEYLSEMSRLAIERPGKPKPVKYFPIAPGYSLIFLDRDGHTSSNSFWGQYYGVNGILVSSPANITSQQVVDIINLSAGDYIQWKVAFTTSDSVFNAYTGKKTRVILTARGDWYPGASGVALPGSHDGTGSEVYVFCEVLYNMTSFVHKIVTHELGHAFRLHHQRVFTTNCQVPAQEYRNGCNMGQCFNEPGQWITGTSLNCSTLQPDRQILTECLGDR